MIKNSDNISQLTEGKKTAHAGFLQKILQRKEANNQQKVEVLPITSEITSVQAIADKIPASIRAYLLRDILPELQLHTKRKDAFSTFQSLVGYLQLVAIIHKNKDSLEEILGGGDVLDIQEYNGEKALISSIPLHDWNNFFELLDLDPYESSDILFFEK